MTSKFSMIIDWSEPDQAFVVTLPDFPMNRTHGTTYEEAAKSGQEVLDILIAMYQADGRPLPVPRGVSGAVAV